MSLELWLTPSFPCLQTAHLARADSALRLGAQNIHWADAGAFTGEVSASQVKACGADFVLLGHAERRTQCGDSDQQIANKIGACVRQNLGVMLCVGEPRDVYHRGRGPEYVARQLEMALAQPLLPRQLIVLYEPVWSIGEGGMPASLSDVQAAMRNIRVVLQRVLPTKADVPILYGGSVDATNAPAYALLPGCAGLGVGRAAWDSVDFLNILEACVRQRLASAPPR
jgi:triosephosphate isomerase